MAGFSRDMLDLGGSFVRRAAAEQGGVITGDNPTHYNEANPLRLWIIQLVIIIGFTQILAVGLKRIRQPRVIAEVIGGIILGPTVMGRIPNFTSTIFPKPSLPLLSLTANIGLTLFLFVVGMEVDFRIIKRNVKAGVAISIAGLVLPLAMGAAVAVPIYKEFVNPAVNYGYFILFIAVAMGITAFPVLCRILTETKLIDTTVGVVTLAAGVGNDVVGWILLALTVALANASSGVNAVYVLLACVGYTIFLFLVVKRGYIWLAKRTGSLENGQPTNTMMTLTLLLVFVSAFFTDIIGVHAIFGAFLVGLIIPHQKGYAIAIVEKLEDLVVIIFLPLYFTLSGLKTNLGTLDTGKDWGYVILVCVFAFFSKFISCGVAAKLTGFNLRESGAIGALMSCKGLVELIVLNVGLSAGVLDTRIFSIFVVHALVLTFITTPLTVWIYPASIRRSDSSKQDGIEQGRDLPTSAAGELKSRFTIVLDKLEQLPSAMTITQLLQNEFTSDTTTNSRSSVADDEKRPLPERDLPELAGVPPRSATSIDALRLVPLSDRTSALLRSQEASYLLRTDPVLSIFRTFGRLNRLAVSPTLSIVAEDSYAATIADHVRDAGSQMVVLPWTVAGAEEEDTPGSSNTVAVNPFAALISQSSSNVYYSHYIRQTFAAPSVDVAVYVDVTSASAPVASHHIVMPFFGGPDDRAALAFVVQLAVKSGVTATVIRISKTDGGEITPSDTIEQAKNHLTIFPDTVYGGQDTTAQMQSGTADDLLWEKYTSPSTTHSPIIAAALQRITFKSQTSATPLRRVVEIANAEITSLSRATIIAVGRSRRLAVESHAVELTQIVATSSVPIGSEIPKTLGPVAAAVIASGVNAGIIVVQAAA